MRSRSEHVGRHVRVATTTGVVEGRLEAIEVGRGITVAGRDGGAIHLDGWDIQEIE